MKNFKKVVSLFLVMALSFLFVSCGDNGENPTPGPDDKQPHEHNFNSKWEYDKKNHWRECSCGEKSEEAAHVLSEWKVKDPATEEKPGLKEKVCTTCNYVETETIPALEHQHSYPEKANKFNETKHWKECDCGEKSEEENHTYKDWVVVKEATEETPGLKERTCSKCEHKQSETIPVLEHQHSYPEKFNKFNETKHWKECGCGEISQEENHRYSFWKYTFPTKDKVGQKTRTCTFCDYKITVEIPKDNSTTGLVFELNEDRNSYSVVGIGTATDANIVIPSTYMGLPVTCIGENAFKDCSFITSVRIPERFIQDVVGTTFSRSIESIGTDAFAGCKNLMKVYYYGTLSSWIELNCSIFKDLSIGKSGQLYLIDEYEKVTLVDNIEIPKTMTEISDYQFANFAITSVSIPKNIESIGAYAFYRCQLSELEIESGVKSIEEYAFANCRNLIDVSIPNSVETIGIHAFDSCGLTTLKLGNGITTLPESVFYNCSKLESVIIPDSVESIETKAFQNCGVLAKLQIGSAVKTIGDYAFADCNIAEVILSDNVLSVGEHAFNMKSNTSIKYVKIGTSVTSIGAFAFSVSSQTSLTIPNSVTSIGANTFTGWNNLENVTMSNKIKTIGEKAFANCWNITSITIPSGIESIDADAFINNYRLVEIYDYSNLNIEIGSTENGSIGQYAKVIHTVDEPTAIIKNGSFVYVKDDTNQYYLVAYRGNNAECVLPDDLEGETYSINDYAFYANGTVTKVEIPSNVAGIGFNAFGECENLTSLTVPYVGASGNETFEDSRDKERTFFGYILGIGSYYDINSRFPESLKNLKEVVITGGTKLDPHAFDGFIYITNITLPASITKIDREVFRDCDSLLNVFYEGDIESWSSIKFSGMNSVENPMYYASHFYLRNSSKDWEEVTSIVIPDTIEELGTYQFYGFDNVKSITIPSNITSIKSNAFGDCYKLVEVYNYSNLNIEKGSTDNGKIGYYAKVIHTTNVASSIFVKDDYQFVKDEDGKCYLIGYEGTGTQLVLPKDVEGNTYDIIQYALWQIEITSITIPFVGASMDGTSNTHFGYIFGANNRSVNDRFVPSSLKEVIITGGSEISNNAFDGCKNITSLVIPKSVTSIGAHAFYKCSSLKDVYYAGSEAEWENISISSSNNTSLINATKHFNYQMAS